MRVRSATGLSLFMIVFGVAVACGDSSSSLTGVPGYGHQTGDGGGGSGTVEGGGGPGQGEALYRALEPQMIQACGGAGGGCHVNAKQISTAPTFLAGPDSYVSIKKYTGIVVPEVFSSIILTKGQHEGPSLTTDVAFEKKVEAWLYEESLELSQVQLPSTDPFSIKLNADNDIDLAKLETGVSGVHLKFKAALVGTALALTNVRLVAPAGTAVHIKHPLFNRVKTGALDLQDPSDSFSNSDQTVPGGAETTLAPGLVIFTAWGDWNNADKLRLVTYKLEKGTLVEASAPTTCKNADNFGAQVAPLLMGNGNAVQLTCTDGNCHGSGGDGQGAMDLSALTLDTPDFSQACQIVLKEIDQKTPANSKLIQKPAGSLSHVGGKVDNQQAFAADITGFITGGTIF